MQVIPTKPTRSTLQNRRLIYAIRGNQVDQHPGLRTISRRANLPRAGRSDLALAVAGSLLIVLILVLTIIGVHSA